MSDIQPAIDNLRDCQQQLDVDGCMVGVSRQALDEVLSEIERLRRSGDGRQAALDWRYDMQNVPMDGSHFVVLCARMDMPPIAWCPYTPPDDPALSAPPRDGEGE